MSIENQPDSAFKRPHVRVEFGGPGHEMEYVLTVHTAKQREAQDLPAEWERELASALGKEWLVMNRGYRLEITPPESKRTSESDAELKKAIKSLVGSGHEVELFS